eukprot:superscaffoldBa00004927_g19649
MDELWWGFFRWVYERFRLPAAPVYGGFPVKFRTFLGDPIPYDPNINATELAEKVQQAVQSLIDKHQQIPGNILRALLERFHTKYNHLWKMSRLKGLKIFIHQRLTAAVEEIFGHLEKTITNYEEEMDCRLRELPDTVLDPEMQRAALSDKGPRRDVRPTAFINWRPYSHTPPCPESANLVCLPEMQGDALRQREEVHMDLYILEERVFRLARRNWNDPQGQYAGYIPSRV